MHVYIRWVKCSHTTQGDFPLSLEKEKLGEDRKKVKGTGGLDRGGEEEGERNKENR